MLRRLLPPPPLLWALMVPLLASCASGHESSTALQRRVRAAEDALMQAAAHAGSSATAPGLAMLHAIERPDTAAAWRATPASARLLMQDIAYRVAGAESGYSVFFFGHNLLSPVNRGGMNAFDPIAILRAAESSADGTAADDPMARSALGQLSVDFRRILLSNR